jgi:hypothetical protein
MNRRTIHMNASISLRTMLFGAAAALALTVSIAAAQTAPDTKSPSAGGSAQKPAGNDQAGSKTAQPAKPAAPAGWATESEARAHCRGTVIWVDKDHFNHYAGSREYGRKPGAFACEKG